MKSNFLGWQWWSALLGFLQGSVRFEVTSTSDVVCSTQRGDISSTPSTDNPLHDSTGTAIIITSRILPSIEILLSEYSVARVEAQAVDMRRYIASRIDSLPFLKLQKDLHQKILTQVIAKSEKK